MLESGVGQGEIVIDQTASIEGVGYYSCVAGICAGCGSYCEKN